MSRKEKDIEKSNDRVVANGKKVLLAMIGVFGLILITTGATLAFFSYTRTGSTENTISSGSIDFVYTEVDKAGRGIQLTDALPMSDTEGKALTGSGNVFNFTISSHASTDIEIPYTISLRKSGDAIDNIVKVYLTDENDRELVAPTIFNQLPKLDGTTNTDTSVQERVLFTDTVDEDNTPYNKSFKLRMWISDQANFSSNGGTCSVNPTVNLTESDCKTAGGTWSLTYPYNGKTFKVTVNVNAKGAVVDVNAAYNASQVSYTTSANNSVETVADALDDLHTLLQ